jgi:type IV pilus assembly protein PilW
MRHRPRLQRGISLVELMVGLAAGLLVVAAATTLLAAQVRQHLQLGIEQRLMQELRSATDVLSRDLRRAGHWGAAAAGIRAPGAAAALVNPYAALAGASAVSFSYSRDAVENHQLDSNEQFGVRLRNGSVELQLGAGNWQALTDATLMTVTTLQITPQFESISLLPHCPGACSASQPGCAASLQVRSLTLVVTARAVADAQVQRSLQSTVRVRNDALFGACPD